MAGRCDGVRAEKKETRNARRRINDRERVPGRHMSATNRFALVVLGLGAGKARETERRHK